MHLGARSIPIEYYILRAAAPATPLSGFGGVVAGYLAGRPILATVRDSAGTCYGYVGLAARLPDGRYDIESLAPDEWIVEPGLIYRAVRSAAPEGCVAAPDRQL